MQQASFRMLPIRWTYLQLSAPSFVLLSPQINACHLMHAGSVLTLLLSKLQSLQLMARENYHKRLSSVETQVCQADVAPSVSIASQKQTKDTISGPGISPMTMKSQPPRKRWLQMGKKLFCSGKRGKKNTYTPTDITVRNNE